MKTMDKYNGQPMCCRWWINWILILNIIQLQANPYSFTPWGTFREEHALMAKRENASSCSLGFQEADWIFYLVSHRSYSPSLSLSRSLPFAIYFWHKYSCLAASRTVTIINPGQSCHSANLDTNTSTPFIHLNWYNIAEIEPTHPWKMS